MATVGVKGLTNVLNKLLSFTVKSAQPANLAYLHNFISVQSTILSLCDCHTRSI